jgi:ubiquinone biosynthesis protein UbiJ
MTNIDGPKEPSLSARLEAGESLESVFGPAVAAALKDFANEMAALHSRVTVLEKKLDALLEAGRS